MRFLGTTTFRAAFIALGFVLAMGGRAALAQVSEQMRFDAQPYEHASGEHEAEPGPLFDDAERKRLVMRHMTLVQSPGANMMRVHFIDYDLGEHSEIHLNSLRDGAVQRFTHAMLKEWAGWSAIFNGDLVLVQLFVAPGDAARFEIDQIAINNPPVEFVEGGVASICGVDNRIASSDSRVGRLSGPNCGNGGSGNGCGGCTAWLTSVGSAVTAGHCGNGSGGLIEFNVPMSASNGAPVAAAPEDQYPVGVTWFASQDGGTGLDWAIMSVGPNSNTGLRAHWVQGYFHLSPNLPADVTTLRITGYGVDSTPAGSQPTLCCGTDGDGNCNRWGCNSASLTLQTATGPKVSHSTNMFTYAVDTEPANSGSPVIWSTFDYAIGVHTNGGCTADGGANAGTRITQSALSQWLNSFISGATFVDFAPVSASQQGTALNPARTVTLGMSLAPVGGTVAIAGGSYNTGSGHIGTFSKAVTLTAVSGNAVIGKIGN